MRVFVAGATGVLGRSLVPLLVDHGHEVIGLSRSEANDQALRRMGATPARADLFDADALARAAKGAEVVVRAATHISTRPRKEDWALNDRIRREGTRALVEAAKRVGAHRFVQESIAWVARPDDGSPFDEKSPPRPDAVTRSALDAERIAAESGLDAVTLRFGWLYGADTPHVRQFADMLRKRRLPVLGDGRAPLSFLHVSDAGTALATAVEGAPTGLWHVVDDEPTPVGDFLDALADAVGARRPRRIPAWVGRLVAGPYVTKVLTTPMLTSSRPYQDASGWRPKLRSAREGIRADAPRLRQG